MCRACGGEWIGGVLLAGMAVTRFGGVAGAINPADQIRVPPQQFLLRVHATAKLI
ncbi:hypothetical protein JX580_02320 [Thiomicrospira microaerophila]|uniref:hypothetical protein n=1 Tax=Thiomicrospira microaerophila TaxID=406020 RepID=UPI00200C7AC4|nr:hypothetical protein [Thiomicrospira microaerophila]UQB42753.1 hypothetical protein JX580_02320 [Thiomicrospira microaerophila]